MNELHNCRSCGHRRVTFNSEVSAKMGRDTLEKKLGGNQTSSFDVLQCDCGRWYVGRSRTAKENFRKRERRRDLRDIRSEAAREGKEFLTLDEASDVAKLAPYRILQAVSNGFLRRHKGELFHHIELAGWIERGTPHKVGSRS